ncbi:hypothetical protein BGZ98_007956 [Dissophora globulifera]|nr:hypothetical protein BGZ98_007956 [Dissophora globulifera]
MSRLQVSVLHADGLHDVEHLAKNDPYCQVTLNINDSNSFQRTSVKKNAGKNVKWNQTLTIDNFQPSQNHLLYVEVFDKDTVDTLIGYTAVYLSQVQEASSHAFKGIYNLFTSNGKAEGTISLYIAILKAGQANVQVPDGPETNGLGDIVDEQQKRIKAITMERLPPGVATIGSTSGHGFHSGKTKHGKHEA